MRTRWRTAAFGVLLAALLVGTAACGSAPAAKSEAGTTSEAAKAPIRIGFVVSQTGNAGSLGQPEANTVELYKDQLSEIDGHPVEWLVVDDGSDPTQAVVAVKRLIEEDKVAAVVCCTISPSAAAIVDTVQSAQLPGISLAASAAVVTPASAHRWMFKTPQNDALMIDILTDYMASHGVKKLAFIGFDDDYGQGGKKALESIAPSKGITIVDEESFKRTDTDATPQVTKMAAAKPDAFIIWAIPPGADVAEKNIKDLGLTQPVYQSHGVANANFIQLGGAAVEGTILPAGKLLVAAQLPDSDPQKAVLLKYKETYEAKYGAGTANTFGGHAYDAMYILAAAIDRALKAGADPADLPAFRAALRDAIEATHDFVGISGIFNYSPDDHHGLDHRAATVVTIQGGTWTLAP
ncbi:MAG: ABC transporter substrate-binding protein [Firmicutes bacterium]|nr:ABC transporter substrate-binding protein [Bacillota bacterium]